MDENFEDTVEAPPRLPTKPRFADDDRAEIDIEDTLVPVRQPPTLVEPPLRPRHAEPSGIVLDPAVEPAADDAPGNSFPSSGPIATPPGGWASQNIEPTPAYFRFRIGRTVVWLDAVSYVGRRPSSPRIVQGRMPRLVRVPSPGHEVSSTHIELRQLGSSVVATDMRSTNGSVVFSPGGDTRRLRQGDSVVVVPGTLVDIGDGNVIEILPLELRPEGDGTQTTAPLRTTEDGRP